MIKALFSLVLGIATAIVPIKAIAAEKITFNVSPFGQFHLEVDDLQTFVETGEASSELAYYLKRLPPKQVEKLPELLSTPLEFHPLTIANFSNSTIGETVIRNFGKGIRTTTNKNGFLALRSAIIGAAFDPQGLTVINLLERFPSETIHVDFKIVEQYIKRGEQLLKNRQVINELFFSDRLNDVKTKITREDLSQPGEYNWQKQTLTYNNIQRSKSGYFDLYLPAKKQSPLIVISHGIASSRETFAYLGEHLVSHGFAVAIVEHDDISLNKFDSFLSGNDGFPEPNNLINQPLDVKHVLDKLERDSLFQDKINLQQVGVIGHSFGAYTSLVLAGGKLTLDPEAKQCQTEDYRNILLDLSSLAKCTFNEFYQTDYQLKDPRIKAVIAINPMGKIFGQAGISSIDIPTMFVSGTNDLVMPPVAEQIQPFSWLDSDIDKYLVLVKPGTHFSFLREGLGILPIPNTVVGISPTQAYPVIKSLTTVFFQAYLNESAEAQQYLQSYSLNSASNNSFQLSIIRSLTNIQLQKLLNKN